MGAEVVPRDVGADGASVARVWSAVEALQRSGIHPAIQLCVRREREAPRLPELFHAFEALRHIGLACPKERGADAAPLGSHADAFVGSRVHVPPRGPDRVRLS